MEKWHTLESAAVLAKLEAKKSGLSEKEAAKRLKQYGPNTIQGTKPVSPLSLFIEQFTNILVIILIIATVFSFLIGEIVDGIAIIIIVILNAIFGFVQEYKAEKAIEALKKLTNPETTVLRDGKQKTVYSSDVVPGDIVLLEECPCELRIFGADSGATGQEQDDKEQCAFHWGGAGGASSSVGFAEFMMQSEATFTQ